MPFKLHITEPDGDEYDDYEVFDTEEEAEEYGDVYASNWNQGAEDLYMSNPGDYPDPDDSDGIEWEVIEVDE